jgi:hypothetical protein
MSFPLRNPTALSSASESNVGDASPDALSWVISELIAQYGIASGIQPTQVVRLARKRPDGEIDRIEVPVHKKDPRLAQHLLKALIPLVGKLGAISLAAVEPEDGEILVLRDRLRTYEDGSHPSCRLRK